jgi:hypothetical protein
MKQLTWISVVSLLLLMVLAVPINAQRLSVWPLAWGIGYLIGRRRPGMPTSTGTGTPNPGRA